MESPEKQAVKMLEKFKKDIEASTFNMTKMLDDIRQWGEFCRKHGMDVNKVERHRNTDNFDPMAQVLMRFLGDYRSQYEAFLSENPDGLTLEKAEVLLKAIWGQGVHVDNMSHCSFKVSALQLAVFYGYQNLVELAVEQGANVNEVNEQGANALMCVTECGKVDIAQYLIDHGANINKVNHHGECILRMAIEDKQNDLLRFLIGKGAPLNQQDSEGNTPCHWAVTMDNLSVLKMLVEAGADFNVTNYKSKSPLMMAQEEFPYNDDAEAICQYLKSVKKALEEQHELAKVVIQNVDDHKMASHDVSSSPSPNRKRI